jgi:hypothetical protein
MLFHHAKRSDRCSIGFQQIQIAKPNIGKELQPKKYPIILAVATCAQGN